MNPHLLRALRAIGACAFLLACWWLPPLVKAVLVVAFSAAATLHFIGRIYRHRSNGKVRASAVSAACVFLAIGPIVVVGLTRGVLKPPSFPAIEFFATVLAIGLVFAILRVEAQDAQRRAVFAARKEAADTLAALGGGKK